MQQRLRTLLLLPIAAMLACHGNISLRNVQASDCPVCAAQLGLRPSQLLPMLRPFERYGNTSSSSTWYAWSFVETCQGVRRGQRLWQLSFGSGFKCASAAWTALRDCNDQHDAWTETPSC